MSIDFAGQVAIVTGAGGGMGRAYALELARRGAALVVNDYGGGVLGEQNGSPGPADAVVAEIVGAGGRAVASSLAVGTAASARAIVQAAIDAFILEEVERRACRSDCDQGVLGAQCRARLA